MPVPACDFFWGPIGQLKFIGKGDAFVSWGKCLHLYWLTWQSCTDPLRIQSAAIQASEIV